MTIQPKFHWKFRDKSGATTTVDSISKAQARFSDARPGGHGRIGLSVHLRKKNAHVNLGKAVGQFGTGDFTIAFGMKNISNHGDGELDIIGSQTMKGHGNFFSVRLSDERIFFHVDENSKAKHYVKIQTDRLAMVPNKTWFHVAVVRKRRTIQIYINGVLSVTAKSKTGVANIKNDTDVKLGNSRRGTPNAQYEDLRIYDRALDASEIQSLIPPANRPLREGEIELVATDGATVILKKDVGHLSRFSREFQKLRVGKRTGATLYQQNNFEGTAQKCYADLPDIKRSKIKSFPGAIQIWSSAGEPFTGKWIIKAPNGQFLSRGKSVLSTASSRSFQELFRFHYNLSKGQLQLLPGSPNEGAVLKISPTAETTPLFVEEIENRTDEFFITNQTKDQWLELGEGDTFNWTLLEENRALFTRVSKRAVDESQVGELAMGEVALYKHGAYYGPAWILSDSEKDQSGNYKRFGDFQDLNDRTSSIRLGPNTGVTLFKHFNNRTTEGKRETEIEDIVENVPHMRDMQIGNDSLSSIRIFRTISPEDVFTSFSTKLSQDYRMVDDKLQEFSSYRTILKFEPGAGEIEVSATDLTEIEVEGTTYEVDERRFVKLKPNELNLIMITSEADGLNTPGLKIRTSDMEINERVVIFPNEEAHQQIANLEDGALWNAKDAKGNLIVDRNAHSKEEVASVQNTIKRVMGTVGYADAGQSAAPSNPSSNAPLSIQSVSVSRSVLRSVNVRAAVQDSVSQAVSADTNSRVQLSNRVVSGATLDKPWVLELPSKKRDNLQQIRALDAVDGTARSTNSPATNIIQEVEISQDEFARLLSQAIPEETNAPQQPVNLPPGFSAIRIGNPFKRVGRAIKKATSVVIGVVKDVVNVVVETAEGAFKFVVDTVEKVAEFVEAVVEKVVKTIKQFIEFLQFLFDWGDILATQRFLFKTINSAFDSADDLVTSAKGRVSSFVDDLQETLNEGTDSIIKSLGGDPTGENKDDTFKLPEAAEWFLNKVLGGSKSSKSQTATNEGTADDSAIDSFQRSLESLLEALTDIAGAGLEVFDGLVDTVKILIANPRRPELALIELLDSVRDVGIKLLDAGENITLAFLDLVVTAIRLFQDALNTEIRIPFISDLFELLGAGKLTILNLLSLLVAIPVTVVSKLIFGEAPFKAVETPAFPVSQPSSQAAVSRSVTSEQSLLSSESAEPAIDIDKTQRKIRGFGALAWACDLLNSMIQAGLDILSESTEFKGRLSDFLEILSLGLSGFSWLASFPASTIEPGGYPYNIAHPDHNVSKSANEEAYWQRVMWGWRTGVLCFDILHMMASFKIGTLQHQRLRRADEFTAALVTALMLVDLGLTSRFLRAAPKDQDKKGLRVASEILPMMPTIFCGLRFIEDATAIALRIAVNAISGIPINFNLLLVNDDANSI